MPKKKPWSPNDSGRWDTSNNTLDEHPRTRATQVVRAPGCVRNGADEWPRLKSVCGRPECVDESLTVANDGADLMRLCLSETNDHEVELRADRDALPPAP
jgi:hypothetical protein